jgi:long-chain acyl-CoA synthetase
MTAQTTATIDGKTIPHAFQRRVQLTPDRTAYLVKKDGAYQPVPWKEVHRQVLNVFGFLKEKKLSAGDKVCIVSNTRPEWNVCDLAIQCAGLTTVPIYQSSTVEDVAFIIEHCEAKLVFAEDEAQCLKLKEAYQTGGKKVPIVVFGDSAPKVGDLSIQPLGEILGRPNPESHQADFAKSVEAVKPTDLCSIVYTSGTTGRPKGVMLAQSNFVSELRGVIEEFHFRPEDTMLTFLPFAHIFGRVESYAPIFAGLTMAFAENINTVAPNLMEVKPTLLLSVPRIYEKVYAKIQSGVEAGPPAKKKLFNWAVDVGRKVARARANRESPSPLLMVQYLLADKLVFSKVRERMGGRIRFTISGGAPLSGELCEFFHACGIKVLEGYGLTETSAAITVNRPDDYAFFTVGKPFGGTEFRLAEDGEILVRGPVVFQGYYKNPEATKEAISEGGWFHTGDIGEFTPRGMLKITDRKKELIVTSAGKNVAPQKLENLLKSIRFISNAMVYGDKEKYLVALVTPNEDECKRWAKANGISGDSLEQIIGNEGLITAVEAEVKNVNQSLASFETIKKIKLIPKDFTVETGELTPSLKLKRRVVTTKYNDMIRQMYT